MKDVLFIKTSSLGDVIHQMPAMTEARAHLDHVDGAMLGRAAYHTPGILAGVDHGLDDVSLSVGQAADLVETMADYAARHIAAGGRLGHVTRHMVGLFHGLPGARRCRQILSTEATKPGAGADVLKRALAAVDFDAVSEAA